MVIYGNLKIKKMITENTTIREFLQTLGTECLRDNLSKNIWAAALFADYKSEYTIIFDSQKTDNPLPTQVPTNELAQNPNWIITDMRFPNEFDAVKAREGITIRVNRVRYISTHSEGEHESERALDNHKFDYVIDNNGSISDLIDKVKEILIKSKII